MLSATVGMAGTPVLPAADVGVFGNPHRATSGCTRYDELRAFAFPLAAPGGRDPRERKDFHVDGEATAGGQLGEPKIGGAADLERSMEDREAQDVERERSDQGRGERQRRRGNLSD